MINKKEIEAMKKYFDECITKEHIFEEDLTIDFMKISKKYIEQLEKEKENNFWQGYIKKQQESVEICKICKYRENYRQKEAELIEANNIINQYKEREQKLIKYLKKEIKVNRKEMNNTNIKLNQIHFMKRIEYAQEMLEILKGEKNE